MAGREHQRNAPDVGIYDLLSPLSYCTKQISPIISSLSGRCATLVTLLFTASFLRTASRLFAVPNYLPRPAIGGLRALLGFPREGDAVQMNSTNPSKKKRSSQQVTNDSEDTHEQSPGGSPSANLNGSSAVSSSNFRNVSACNRCRLRKNRCDQKLPACTSCDKANVK